MVAWTIELLASRVNDSTYMRQLAIAIDRITSAHELHGMEDSVFWDVYAAATEELKLHGVALKRARVALCGVAIRLRHLTPSRVNKLE